ncbi:hypothetical protein HY572_02535 [Candidatus Micrarchaeota archaeon]|nr:hypothetical protein [Candidatus Micrarchaeota archaeon]
MKEKTVALVAGVWLVVDALLSIVYSTDLILLFQVGRVARLVIGLFLLFGHIPKKYGPLIGVYLALEAIGSTAVSPDEGLLWQAGRIGRVFIGILFYQKKIG